MDHPSVEGFWYFVAERERIRLRRAAGSPPPWTTDPYLRRYHFCNIRRADDYGTRWYLKHVAPPWGQVFRSPAAAHDFRDLVWRTTFYRVVNSVEYFEAIGGVFNLQDWYERRSEMREIIERGPKPNSHAYLIFGSRGDRRTRKEKLAIALTHMLNTLPEVEAKISAAMGLQEIWLALRAFHGVGEFISMQIYRDLQLAGAIGFENDPFCYIGPGAERGMRALFPETGAYPDMYRRMEELHAEQRNFLPAAGFDPLPLADVEHCLCEYYKYLKAIERLTGNSQPLAKLRTFVPRKEPANV